MSKRKDKVSSTLSKIITYILVVLLLLGFAGVIVYFVAKNEGVSFYVEYDGKRYYSGIDDDELFLVSGENHSFFVKSLTGGEVNYDVTVQSNYSNNFDFVIDGEYKQFYSTTDENNDYAAVFSLQKKADGFSLTLPDHFTVEQAVETQYGGDIELQDGYEIDPDLCYFVITVTSDESSVSLWFTFGGHVDGITLDPPQIVF